MDLDDTEDGPAFTVKQLCQHYHISPTLYYELRKQGKGPREAHFGRCVRILHQARKEWECKCCGELAQLLTIAPRLLPANDNGDQDTATPRPGD
ncbi:hypothetical protein LMG31506_00004 [Cupriavidus yeoncheonensis]|uniref:Uncharacterized protein n=1 Tax=Cupriavidus yeoncheonensis TaxID=1462994 RepID=A0A916MVM2_9BURK|nr:hypothetical protein [Cupriavidus yeoncheonensis]CAG2126520.1 hypothetical protein LMG31506_00004 [Cupriavidus yeoncheonensis]